MVALTLSGCIPGRFEGYRPSGAGDRESSACVAGIRDVLRMPASSGVDILLRAVEDRDRTILLDASIVVPEGIVVRLRSSAIVFRSDEWPARVIPIVRITGNAREYRPLAGLSGSDAGSAGTYALWFGSGTALWRTDAPAARSFTVEFPALEIAGQPFQPEPVAFERYSEWGTFTCAQ
jgi:hypothetical protein